MQTPTKRTGSAQGPREGEIADAKLPPAMPVSALGPGSAGIRAATASLAGRDRRRERAEAGHDRRSLLESVAAQSLPGRVADPREVAKATLIGLAPDGARHPTAARFAVADGPASGSGTTLLGGAASMIVAVILLLALPNGPASAQMLRHGAEPAPPPPVVGTPVCRWSLAADRLGRGVANWRTMAVMHVAMHDALNAAEPRFGRWAPPTPDEPAPDGASPLIAMAAAAYQVLLARHQENAAEEADALFRAALTAEPPGPSVDAGIRLGVAIGLATVARYAAPATLPQPFPAGLEEGRWRPTPPFLQNGLVGDAKPFLFGTAEELRGHPPPPPRSPRYIAEAEEVRRLGGEHSTERTPQQSEAAYFWAYQSSQRNFVHLAARLLQDHPPSGGAWAQARLMSQLSVALADSFVLAWDEKRHWARWRPVTALALGSDGVPADPAWEPLFGTPPHPDYPSGHATGCSAGARVLEGVYGASLDVVAYTAHDLRTPATRHFPTFASLASECAESRIWAGAHFRSANEEGQRLGAMIARRALESVPSLER